MSFYIYETTVEKEGDVGMTETELLQKLTIELSRCDGDKWTFDSSEIFQLLEMARRMKNSLGEIAWHVEATSPQAMIMKDIARKGLYRND